MTRPLMAAAGTLFTRAYVQYSFCAPSRNSFMVSIFQLLKSENHQTPFVCNNKRF